MTSCPISDHPHDVGVEEICPELAQIEGAHLLANAAREFLRGCGFDDREILEWAETYITTARLREEYLSAAGRLTEKQLSGGCDLFVLSRGSPCAPVAGYRTGHRGFTMGPRIASCPPRRTLIGASIWAAVGSAVRCL